MSCVFIYNKLRHCIMKVIVLTFSFFVYVCDFKVQIEKTLHVNGAIASIHFCHILNYYGVDIRSTYQ